MAQTKYCVECGKEFKKSVNCSQKEWENRRFCSRECHYDHGREIKECKNCGKEFKVPKSQDRIKFCSGDCRNNYISNHPDEYNLFKKGHKAYISKPWEGKSMPEEMKQKMSESTKRTIEDGSYDPVTNVNNPLGNSGKDHWNWKGGKSYEEYPLEFNLQLRRKIRERDNYTCQECRLTQEESKENYNRRLSVHHKDLDKNNNDKSNLQTLCIKCHRQKHSNEEQCQKKNQA